MSTRPVNPRLARWLALALAASATTCFTGDGLVDQPCRTDADCNPPLDALGASLRCEHNVCGYRPRCGDGIVDAEEACDRGVAHNVDDDYAAGPGECSVQCRELPYCGDGHVDPEEACDDDTDQCTPLCQRHTCGDGLVGPGEACDDGDADELACTAKCRLPSCGNGDRDPGEACDDGDLDDTDECTSTCLLPTCGDGHVGPGEACDDANAENQDDCLDTCEKNTCGDGFVGPGEACDDGNLENDDGCTNACAGPDCGDGFVGPDEECDDGDDDDTDDCLSTCLKNKCGDGHLGPGEQCDDGNTSNSDTCVAGCKPDKCGDTFVGPAEACDDGNKDDDDGCTNACALPTCGDGVVQQGEECDFGDKDDGDKCSSTCKHEKCGDGVVHAGEQCDDGNTVNDDGCSAACEFEKCGDGAKQTGEQCDDGNTDNDDACVQCKSAFCGDNALWTKEEECDDGNTDNDDACVACKPAVCGDGHIWAPVETCDDGNADDDDDCVQCVHAFCGDGKVKTQGDGTEACDDGNAKDTDPCKSDCTKNYCGDGVVDATSEGCDDKNGADDDGCSNACDRGAGAIGGGPQAFHFCAIQEEGKVRCWGKNDSGQLGVGSKANLGDEPGELPAKAVDVPANPPGTRVVKVTGGASHTCVILAPADPNAARSVRCWGAGDNGKLGVGVSPTQGDDPGESPADVVALDAVDIAAGAEFTCAALAHGGVRCWGLEDLGRLGQPGVSKNPPTAMPDIQLGGKAIQVTAAEYHACALLADGAVRCWGSNGGGKLGLKKTSMALKALGDDEAPSTQPPVDLGEKAIQVAAGGQATCAVLESGRLRCWGGGSYGVLGYGDSKDIGDDEHPKDAGYVKMLSDTDVVTRVVVSAKHTCALLADGSVRCWGYGGLLGLNNTTGYGSNAAKPPPVLLGDVAIDLVAGGHNAGWSGASTCALLHRGRVRCWGTNDDGQLGRGHTDPVGDGPGEMPPPDSPIYFNP